MRELILIIGLDIAINRPFLEYILREYRANFKSFADMKIINKTDSEIFQILENLSLEYDNITAYASSENFSLIAKIIASLTNDMLEVRQNILAPTLSTANDGGFLVKLNKANLNLINANPLEKLAKPLIEDKKQGLEFFIYGFEVSSIKYTLDELGSKFDIDITSLPYSKFITLINIRKRKFGNIDGFLEETKALFKEKIIFEESLASFIVKKLKQRGEKITFAESCTAGLIASKIGEISGASDVFDGSVVTYANSIKSSWLRVSDETLQNYGAVSKECVLEMLYGALDMNEEANYALAVSGIAGPNGGSEEKPVGTVFIGAIKKDESVLVKEFHFGGDRNYIREESVNVAFSLLFELGNFFEE